MLATGSRCAPHTCPTKRSVTAASHIINHALKCTFSFVRFHFFFSARVVVASAFLIFWFRRHWKLTNFSFWDLFDSSRRMRQRQPSNTKWRSILFIFLAMCQSILVGGAASQSSPFIQLSFFELINNNMGFKNLFRFHCILFWTAAEHMRRHSADEDATPKTTIEN